MISTLFSDKRLDVPKEAASAHVELVRSCRGYERTMRNTLKELLFSAFNDSSPNPTAPNHEIVSTITSKTDRDFKISVRTFESADFQTHHDNRVSIESINSDQSVPTAKKVTGTTESLPTDTSADNETTVPETITMQPETNPISMTESALDASPAQNPIIVSSYDDILRSANHLNDVNHNAVLSRDKIFIFTTLGLACVALLSAYFGAWDVSLQNAKKISQLESQVSNLIDVQRDQNTGSSLVTVSSRIN